MEPNVDFDNIENAQPKLQFPTGGDGESSITDDYRESFKCRAATAAAFLVIYFFTTVFGSMFVKCASIFSGGFAAWVVFIHLIFAGIVAVYGYYALNYRYEPNDTWPRIRLDLAVFGLVMFMGLNGGLTIEGNDYLNYMRGRSIDMNAWSPEEQTTFTEKWLEFADVVGPTNVRKMQKGKTWNITGWFDSRMGMHSFCAWCLFIGCMCMALLSIYHHVSDEPKNIYLIGSIEKHSGIS